jgi:hypothetical protein
MAWEAYPWHSLTIYSELGVTKDANNVTSMTVPADAGEIVGVYSQNPLATTQAVYKTYALTTIAGVDKIVVQTTDADKYWVEYRFKRPDIQGELYKSIPYKAGAYVYFDTGSETGTYMPIEGKPHYGNFFKAKQDVGSSITPMTSSFWEKIEVPYIFGTYLSRGVYADFLRSEQQYEDAQKAESDASAMLEMEFDKELRQQGQIRRINFISSY